MDGEKFGLNGVLTLTSNMKKLMAKEELGLQINRAMHKGDRTLECFNSYQCIKGYFLDLQVEDLVSIASQYDINS